MAAENAECLPALTCPWPFLWRAKPAEDDKATVGVVEGTIKRVASEQQQVFATNQMQTRNREWTHVQQEPGQNGRENAIHCPGSWRFTPAAYIGTVSLTAPRLVDEACPAYMMSRMNKSSLEDRLLRKSKAQKRTGCRIWQGMVQKRGNYGMIRKGGTNGGSLVPAHRAAWFVRFGEWPERKIFNDCGNTLCIEPDHWIEKEAVCGPDPEGNRRRWLKSKYNMSIEEYDAMLKKQKGRCAICRKKINGNLSVDHCHKTGKNRSLLCKACNNALGNIQDDIETAKAIVAYLRKHGAKTCR